MNALVKMPREKGCAVVSALSGRHVLACRDRDPASKSDWSPRLPLTSRLTLHYLGDVCALAG
jgi:hypothetical protein